MNKRQFLQVLPLAALTATTVKVDNVEAQAHELKPEKKYLIALPGGMTEGQAVHLSKLLRERLGSNAVVVAGKGAVGMKVYELE